MICAPSFAMVYLNVISFFVPNIVLAYIFVKMLAVPHDKLNPEMDTILKVEKDNLKNLARRQKR